MAGNLTVFAAASLADSFAELGGEFSRQHPRARVVFSFDASSSLAAQITRGAPADVFASADMTTMDQVASAGLATSVPRIFASNRLALIVGNGNPLGVAGLSDLTAPKLKVVVCDESVPCGRYARKAFDDARLTISPVSFEQNVKGVVTKVAAGEADAGIVYATDARTAEQQTDQVAVAELANIAVAYPVTALTTSKRAALAAAFVDFVLSSVGQAVLTKFGFGPP